jgi:hypothetical protein
MLRLATNLQSYRVNAIDGETGHVKDAYFDDENWVIRYLVIDPEKWSARRSVLISPVSVGRVDTLEEMLYLTISRASVQSSPDIDTDSPVSRHSEAQLLGHYGYRPYWDGMGIWGDGMYPDAMAPGYSAKEGRQVERDSELEAHQRNGKSGPRDVLPQLRSWNDVVGYDIRAVDGDIGYISDFLVDDKGWVIRYLVIETSKWWGGRTALVSPRWISDVRWSDRAVCVDLSRASIESAPPYDSAFECRRDHERTLYRHFHRTGYWAGSTALQNEA